MGSCNCTNQEKNEGEILFHTEEQRGTASRLNSKPTQAPQYKDFSPDEEFSPYEELADKPPETARVRGDRKIKDAQPNSSDEFAEADGDSEVCNEFDMVTEEALPEPRDETNQQDADEYVADWFLKNL